MKEKRMVAYLLGTASEDERASLEEQFFADDQLFEELSATETELIDAYVNGELSPGEREAFEKRYLASEASRARVALARQLLERGRHRSRRYLYGLAAAAVILIAAVVTFSRAPQMPAPAPAPAQPSSSPAPGNPPAVSSPPVVLTLRPGLTRSPTGGASLAAPQSGQIRLRLEYNGRSYASYRAVVRTAEGRTIWTGADLGREMAAGPAIALDLPASVLVPGDYVILLFGASDADGEIADYAFRVRRR